MSAHSTEEVAEDGLDIDDIEHAVVHGRIAKVERNDPRGVKYVIHGPGQRSPVRVGVVVRSAARWLVITVYRMNEVNP